MSGAPKQALSGQRRVRPPPRPAVQLLSSALTRSPWSDAQKHDPEPAAAPSNSPAGDGDNGDANAGLASAPASKRVKPSPIATTAAGAVMAAVAADPATTATIATAPTAVSTATATAAATPLPRAASSAAASGAGAGGGPRRLVLPPLMAHFPDLEEFEDLLHRVDALLSSGANAASSAGDVAALEAVRVNSHELMLLHSALFQIFSHSPPYRLGEQPPPELCATLLRFVCYHIAVAEAEYTQLVTHSPARTTHAQSRARRSVERLVCSV